MAKNSLVKKRFLNYINRCKNIVVHLIAGIMLVALLFGLSIEKASATFPLDCAAGEAQGGSCINPDHPSTEGGWYNGHEACSQIARSPEVQNVAPGTTATCRSHCVYNAGPWTKELFECNYTQGYAQFLNKFCPRMSDPLYNPDDGGCYGTVEEETNFSPVFCCDFSAPTPTPCVELGPHPYGDCTPNSPNACGVGRGTQPATLDCPPYSTTVSCAPSCGTCRYCSTDYQCHDSLGCITPTPECSRDDQCYDGDSNYCTYSPCVNEVCQASQRRQNGTVCDLANLDNWCCSGVCGTDPTCGGSGGPTLGPTSPPAPTMPWHWIPTPGVLPTGSPGGGQEYNLEGYVFMDDYTPNGIQDPIHETKCYQGQVIITLTPTLPWLTNPYSYTQDISCNQKYSFLGLSAGTYTVNINPIINWISTTPLARRTYTFTLPL
jgi:hypothetical protein